MALDGEWSVLFSSHSCRKSLWYLFSVMFL